MASSVHSAAQDVADLGDLLRLQLRKHRQGQTETRPPLALWERSSRQLQTFVGLLQVKRYRIVHPGAHAGAGERCPKTITIGVPHHVQVPYMAVPWEFALNLDGAAGQMSFIGRRVSPSSFVPGLEAPQLDPQCRSLQCV